MIAAIIFLIVFIALGVFVIYLARNIEHGEARFDSSGKVMRDEETGEHPDEAPAPPAQPIETPNHPDTGDRQ